EDHPGILGGRDLQAMGTWMAISKKGRFAAVTNYRDPSNIRSDVKSRGDLPLNFLTGDQAPKVYGQVLQQSTEDYNGYNLLAFDGAMVHFSNYENRVNELEPGIHGLSNALLNTSWPKVRKAKERLKEHIANDAIQSEYLIEMMQDTALAEDDQLPETGLSMERERALSPMCIRTSDYGTCCSTFVTVDYEDNVQFMEKSYPVGLRKDESVFFTFKIEN
ncbi:MAG: NRDE family protein, partial [Bacteroidota bacterium]